MKKRRLSPDHPQSNCEFTSQSSQFSSGCWRRCVCCRYWVRPTSGMRAQNSFHCYSEPNKKTYTYTQIEHSSTNLPYLRRQPPATSCRLQFFKPSPAWSQCWEAIPGVSDWVFRNNQTRLLAPVHSQGCDLHFGLGQQCSRPPNQSKISVCEGRCVGSPHGPQ